MAELSLRYKIRKLATEKEWSDWLAMKDWMVGEGD
jgi:hypothetical protein